VAAAERAALLLWQMGKWVNSLVHKGGEATAVVTLTDGQAAEKYNTMNDMLIDQLGILEENKSHFFQKPLVRSQGSPLPHLHRDWAPPCHIGTANDCVVQPLIRRDCAEPCGATKQCSMTGVCCMQSCMCCAVLCCAVQSHEGASGVLPPSRHVRAEDRQSAANRCRSRAACEAAAHA
jgi:hypothetical protein